MIHNVVAILTEGKESSDNSSTHIKVHLKTLVRVCSLIYVYKLVTGEYIGNFNNPK